MAFNKTHVLSIKTLADALYPPSPDGGSGSTPLSEQPMFVERIEEGVTTHLDYREFLELKVLLILLNTAAGTSLLYGGPSSAFTSLDHASRGQVLACLSRSSIGLRRKAFNGLKRLLMGTALSYNAKGENEAPHNPVWSSLKYPGPPVEASNVTAGYDFLGKSYVDVNNDDEFDYIIIGSGCGGSVVARQLCKVGKCLIIEKGTPLPSDLKDVSQCESEGMSKFYEKGSLLTTSDGSLMILAGSALGGGSTVNWGCCLDTPKYVREEWNGMGLSQFHPDGEEFNGAMAEVKKYMGVTDTGIVHNGMNKKLIEGCDKNKFEWEVAPQNIKDTSLKSAGWTCFGPRQGNKQGGGITWLREYSDNGGKFFEGLAVKVVTKSGKATGVVVCANSDKDSPSKWKTLNVRRKVICSAGSLHSPLFLQRSGFRNKNIGSNLRLHPVSAVMATCKEEVFGYEGAPMTTVCTEFQNGVNDDGYGPKLECPSVHTGVMAAALPWKNGSQFKEALESSSKMVAVIVLQRDIGGGTVTGKNKGFDPVVDYVPDTRDEENIKEGLKRAFDILRACDTVEKIWTCHVDQPQYDAPSAKAEGSAADLVNVEAFYKAIDENGVGVNSLGLFCAHQMGSCRMGQNPNAGAVDEDGELWECENLHVIDASVFPTASGANPMITTMSIAQMLGSRLVEMQKATERGAALLEMRRVRRKKFGGKRNGKLNPLWIGAFIVGAVGAVSAYVGLLKM